MKGSQSRILAMRDSRKAGILATPKTQTETIPVETPLPEQTIEQITTTAKLRYFGMLHIMPLMCTCGTVIGALDTRGMKVSNFLEAVGSQRPCCARFFSFGRLTFASDHDIVVGSKGRDSTCKIVKIGAVAGRSLMGRDELEWEPSSSDDDQEETERFVLGQ